MRSDILTISGNYFNFLTPEQSAFGIWEIAHGLSHVCRFAGQCTRFYSVAQHSVLVSRVVPERFAKWGVLHDASEAFIGDLTRPLKALIPEYREIEERIESAIFGRFGLAGPKPGEVKVADMVLLATEQRDLMPWHGDSWSCIEGVQPLRETIVPLSPVAAFQLFMARYHEICLLESR